MKTMLILFVTLLVCANSYAQSTFSFLKLDASARSAALEGSFVSNADDPNVIFYNPAGVGFLKNDQLSIGFLKHLLDVNSGFLSYTPFIKGIGRVGFAAAYTNYGSFDLKDEYGNKLGTLVV
ncbi:MAG: hypothetical protein N3A61_06055, partial [Ignavibacteria bacterium]|nr:hypothetical protein [Ignavibacteria bacterium]